MEMIHLHLDLLQLVAEAAQAGTHQLNQAAQAAVALILIHKVLREPPVKDMMAAMLIKALHTQVVLEAVLVDQDYHMKVFHMPETADQV